MKRILTAVFVLLASLTGTTLLAQGGYQVKGVVVDAMGPVIGAAVVQQGTTNGTSTGIDGDFVLNVPNGDAVIEISCIGYATQTFKASEVPASVFLEEDSHFLDEVVVIGYGTVKKSDLTGSVSTVKADEINKGVVSSPADLLRGKSAGVVVTAGDGMPGSAATLTPFLQRHKEEHAALDAVLTTGHTGVAHAMAALIEVEWCLARFPTRIPHGVAVADIEIATAIVHRHTIIAITCQTAEFGILVKGVATGSVGNQREKVFIA